MKMSKQDLALGLLLTVIALNGAAILIAQFIHAMR